MSYTVIYRTGGTDNFKWNRCAAVATSALANEQAEAIRRGGRLAYVHKTVFLNIVGLPESFDATSPIPEARP